MYVVNLKYVYNTNRNFGIFSFVLRIVRMKKLSKVIKNIYLCYEKYLLLLICLNLLRKTG